MLSDRRRGGHHRCQRQYGTLRRGRSIPSQARLCRYLAYAARHSQIQCHVQALAALMFNEVGRNGMGIRCAVTILSMLCALPAAAQMRAFTGATIIDGNGGKPIANGVVLVEGRTIKAVGPAARVSIPREA